MLETVKSTEGKIIFIDNADSILTDQARRYIGLDPRNQYIICARDTKGLWVNERMLADLDRNDRKKTIELNYKYMNR